MRLEIQDCDRTQHVADWLLAAVRRVVLAVAVLVGQQVSHFGIFAVEVAEHEIEVWVVVHTHSQTAEKVNSAGLAESHVAEAAMVGHPSEHFWTTSSGEVSLHTLLLA